MYYLDTETCGLCGPAVLIQYAEDDGPIILYDVWHKPIDSTLSLIERVVDSGIIGFNLTFDWFQLVKLYTMFSLFPYKDAVPYNHVDTIAELEHQATLGPCLKPRHAFDVMLHARKGPYQSTMNRADIKIKRVPTQLAWQLAEYLDKAIPLNDIYFARYADPSRRWQITDTDSNEFKTLLLKFAPSSALKALAADALNIDHKILHHSDVEVPKYLRPKELEYAPYCTAVGSPGRWNGAWPDVVQKHADHWLCSPQARVYASDDVDYTRRLYQHFGSPPIDDDDSVLACMVAVNRWRGYTVDIEGIKKLRQEALDRAKLPFNHRSPKVVKKYLLDAMTPTESVVMYDASKRAYTTKGLILESISKWTRNEICDKCLGDGCPDCPPLTATIPHPAALRAREILNARRAEKEVELYDKLLAAGKLHPDLKIIGTKSSRMSGSGGLNVQGIKRAKKVRKQFPLANEGYILCGGDFEADEVATMAAVCGDSQLQADLLETETCRECKGVNSSKCHDCRGTGKQRIKIHGLFGTFLFPPHTYNEIMESKGKPGEQDLYSRAKSGVFCVQYGGEEYSLETRVGIEAEHAKKSFARWKGRYKGWGKWREGIFDSFCSMRQPKGLGTRIEWHDPADFIDSLFGFKRFFTLENRIVRELFNLAGNPPKHWTELKIKVTRRDREQTVCGATRSALYGAAFAVQADNMRAAANHVIQSSCGVKTKGLQRRIWDIQPFGIGDLLVQPLNVHDEIMTPCRESVVEQVREVVTAYLTEMRKLIPLVDMNWSTHMKTWADK